MPPRRPHCLEVFHHGKITCVEPQHLSDYSQGKERPGALVSPEEADCLRMVRNGVEIECPSPPTLPIEKRRGGGGDSVGSSGYSGGSSSAPSQSPGSSLGSSSSGFKPAPAPAPAPKAATPSAPKPAAPKPATPKPAAPYKPGSKPVAAPAAPKLNHASKPAAPYKPASKPAPAPAAPYAAPAPKPKTPNPAPLSPNPAAPKLASTTPAAPPALAPKPDTQPIPPPAPPSQAKSSSNSASDLVSTIYGNIPKAKKPKSEKPNHDHGHLSLSGATSGSPNHKSVGHTSSCGTGCKGALIGTFGALAVLGGLALLVGWLIVRRKRRGKERKKEEEDGIELTNHVSRGVSFVMTEPSLKSIGSKDSGVERTSGSLGAEGKAPTVAMMETGGLEFSERGFVAVEAVGRASPVVVDVGPRSSSGSSEGSGSDRKRGSGSSGSSGGRKLSSIPEEAFVMPEEEEYHTADDASGLGDSRTSSCGASGGHDRQGESMEEDRCFFFDAPGEEMAHGGDDRCNVEAVSPPSSDKRQASCDKSDLGTHQRKSLDQGDDQQVS